MNTTSIARAREYLMRIPWPLLVLLMTALSYVVTLPLYLLPSSSDTYTGPARIFSLPPYSYFLSVVVVGPMIETVLLQWLPIRLCVKKFGMKTADAGFVSAGLFAIAHPYSIQYVVLAFLIGVVLAGTFVVAEARGSSPFWMVTAVHTLRNGITFVRVAL